MDWIKNYRIINKNEFLKREKRIDWNSDGQMDYLFEQHLDEFEFGNEITEDEFLDGSILYLMSNDDLYLFDNWCIHENLTVNILIERRKEKLDGLDK
jgi:hypothetical protein